jgi:16S rRNA (cytosine967-C5)-methyltransferase
VTPGARIAAAIEVIDAWAAGPEGLDRTLAAWGRAHRFAGAKDRRAIADLAYDAVRRLRSSLWLAGIDAPDPLARSAPGRPALIGSLRLDGADPGALFTGEAHAPGPLSAGERGARPIAEAPRGVRLDLPDWLLAERFLGSVPDAAIERLRRRAPLHLRVNLLKADAETARAALDQDGVRAEPGRLSPTCLAVTEGARRVAGSRAFRDGLVEVQDAASQAVADLCAARPGERVLDLCAGGGGKALALAAAMGGHGELFAHDAAEARLAQLAPRAERAGVRIRIVPPGEAPPERCDLVLVDAPCSGSGAWARNPDAKWRLTPAALDALRETQGALLVRAAGLIRPGGRLVYATCSMMPAENADTVDAFLAAHPCFREVVRRRWTPLDGGDGFFAAVLSPR